MLSRGIVHEDEVLCAAADAKLALAVWYGVPTEFHLDRIDQVIGERVRLYSAAVLLIIVTKPVLPDETCRRRMSGIMHEHRKSLLAIDVCIEVDGLFGGALKTLARGIVLASRARTPTTCSTSVPEAAEQLERAVGRDVLSAEQIRKVVFGVRTNYSSRRPPAMIPA